MTKYGENIGEGCETVVGDNVFIGRNSIILMGTHIGSNVIIGAGSVVHGVIPDNVVAAGNPARTICTLDEHLEKRRNRTADEAVNTARSYKQKYGKCPSELEMSSFRELFGGNAVSEKYWTSFEDFLKEIN